MSVADNCVELYQRFNLLWNNIASGKAPGLEKYEISLLLTQAQEELVKDYFSRRANSMVEGFDDSVRRQSDFSNLMKEGTCSSATGYTDTDTDKYFTVGSNSFLVVNEEVKCVIDSKTTYLTVVPISYEEYVRLRQKPFKYPPKGTVWRLTVGKTDGGDEVVRLIAMFSSDATITYGIRYVSRPAPIILEALTNGLKIEGQTAQADCKLPIHLHEEVVKRAVQLAKISWIDTAASQINS